MAKDPGLAGNSLLSPLRQASYNIIYADPPWNYSNNQDHNPTRGGKTYPLMSQDEIKGLPVASIAAPDCALFLWATMPKLQEALDVIAAWGFRYVTCAFTWVKINPTGQVVTQGRDVLLEKGIYSGLGYWTNGNAELCLLGKRGRPERFSKSVKQIVVAPRGRHSAKPPEVRDRIVQLMGALPRVELFARENPPGWDVWGKDVVALPHPVG